MFGTKINYSVWEVEFMDGFTIEFVDTSRKQIVNHLGNTNKYNSHGMCKRITRIKRRKKNVKTYNLSSLFTTRYKHFV